MHLILTLAFFDCNETNNFSKFVLQLMTDKKGLFSEYFCAEENSLRVVSWLHVKLSNSKQYQRMQLLKLMSNMLCHTAKRM